MLAHRGVLRLNCGRIRGSGPLNRLLALKAGGRELGRAARGASRRSPTRASSSAAEPTAPAPPAAPSPSTTSVRCAITAPIVVV